MKLSELNESKSNVVFRQRIKFDRAAGLHGDLYKGTKPVGRAVMVVKSDQSSSVMVKQGKPYVAFITGNEAFRGDKHPHSHFFATAEEAVNFAKEELKHHELIGEPDGSFFDTTPRE